MIDSLTIERILDAADITSVISEFVTLKKRGVNLLGLCPFHNEKTPSFTVSPAKGIYKCFGCGKGGNSVNFIMEHESLTYPEALKWLARKYGIDVKEEEESEEVRQLKDERESMMIVSAFAQQYFTRYLWEEEEGVTIGTNYLKERGIRENIARTFELGFCPDGKDIFTQQALKNGYKMEYLDKTGLSIKRDDWVRDRFAGRLMFPIHNVAGRVIAFGGRTLKTSKDTAKYLNSPESEIYHKSQVLYGIFQAKREINRQDKCYLVEGYTDVISLHQAGIENVVASSGTSLTSDQIRLIKRFTSNVTILYDGDAAGIKASLRGIDMLLEEGLNVKVLLFPEGDDPDSFSRSRSSTEVSEFLRKNETDFIRFKANILLKDAENDPVERARIINDIISSIAVVPNTLTRSVYIQECSRLMNVPEEVLYTEMRKKKSRQHDEYIKTQFQVTVRPQQKLADDMPVVANKCEIEEREILRILLKYFHHEAFKAEGEHPGEIVNITVGRFVMEEIAVDDLQSEDEIIATMMNIFAENTNNKSFQPISYFTNHPNPLISKLTVDLIADKYVESRRWRKNGAWAESEEDLLDLLVQRIVNEYKLRKLKCILHDIEEQIKNLSDMDQIIDLQSKHKNLKKVEKYFSEQLGNRAIT